MSIMSLLFCLILNMIISNIMYAMVPNYYLATMFSSLVIAFIYPLFSYVATKRKIISVEFLSNFLFNSIFLLVIDIVFFLIQ